MMKGFVEIELRNTWKSFEKGKKSKIISLRKKNKKKVKLFWAKIWEHQGTAHCFRFKSPSYITAVTHTFNYNDRNVQNCFLHILWHFPQIYMGNHNSDALFVNPFLNALLNILGLNNSGWSLQLLSRWIQKIGIRFLLSHNLYKVLYIITSVT